MKGGLLDCRGIGGRRRRGSVPGVGFLVGSRPGPGVSPGFRLGRCAGTGCLRPRSDPLARRLQTRCRVGRGLLQNRFLRHCSLLGSQAAASAEEGSSHAPPVSASRVCKSMSASSARSAANASSTPWPQPVMPARRERARAGDQQALAVFASQRPGAALRARGQQRADRGHERRGEAGAGGALVAVRGRRCGCRGPARTAPRASPRVLKVGGRERRRRPRRRRSRRRARPDSSARRARNCRWPRPGSRRAPARSGRSPRADAVRRRSAADSGVPKLMLMTFTPRSISRFMPASMLSSAPTPKRLSPGPSAAPSTRTGRQSARRRQRTGGMPLPRATRIPAQPLPWPTSSSGARRRWR